MKDLIGLHYFIGYLIKMKKYNPNNNLYGLFGMPPAFICNIAPAMGNKKVKYQKRNHAKKRAYERYGIKLNGNDLYQMAKKIKNGYATNIKESKRKYQFTCYIRYKNNIYKVAYDKNLGMITTFLE